VVAEGYVGKDGHTVVTCEDKPPATYARPEDMLAVYRDKDTWVLSVPEGWEMSLDPFHGDAFVGTPAEGVVTKPGTRKAVWLENDDYGQAIGVGPAVIDHAQTGEMQ
jgi:hypothetical protein